MSRKLIAFSVDKDTWIPFTRSLENVILNHQVSQDLKELAIPIDVIYGTFDMIVIRGHTQKVIGSTKDDVRHHNIRARHVISIKSSRFIAKRVFEGFNDQIQKNVS